MRRSAVLASLVLAAVATTATAQETFLLRLGGQPGQTNRYQGTMETFMRGGPMASMMSSDTTLPMMRITTISTRTMTGTAGDTLIFTDVIDSVAMESPAMPQMAAMMGAAISQLRGQTTTTRMDARGRIFGITINNPNGDPTGGRGNRMPGMGGGGQRTMFNLPAQAVRLGDTWNDSMNVASAGPTDPATNLVASYRLERVDNRGGVGVAVVSINGSMAQVNPQGGQSRFAVTGQFQLDLVNHRLAGITMTMTGVVTSQMGEIPMRMQMTQSLVP
jgi:hypothetical protein